MLLAIDTSTRQASVALYEPGRGLLAEQSWFSANRHTEELMPAIAVLMRLASSTPGDLTAVGVAIGPGSFTGLRVGLAAAKGLALAQGVTLLGIPTLDVTAHPHESQPVPVIAVAQAGRGRLYWAPYAHGPSGWAPQEPYTLSTVIEVANTLVRPMVFAGELSDADRETLTSFAGKQRVVVLSSALGLRRAGVLAELALRRLEAGEADDPATLSPIYLQHPDGSKSARDGRLSSWGRGAVMMPFISPMEPADLDAIMPLERVAFADPWTRRMYLSDLTDNPLAAYSVIRTGDQDGLPPILGWAGFWLLVDEAHVATVAAHPQYRGCGLGQWLMVALLDKAQARGARVATLEVRVSNLSARKLYDKLGFDVVGTRRKYYRDGEDGLIMTTPPLANPQIQMRLETAREDALERVARCLMNEGAADGAG